MDPRTLKFAEATEASFASDRWPLILTLLSMDRVIVFADMMGFGVADRPAFVGVLRSLILQMRQAQAAGRKFYDADHVAERLVAELGSETTNHLAWWGQHIFGRNTQDHLALNAWTITLRHCRHEPQSWAQLGLATDFSEDAMLAFQRSIDTTEYYRRQWLIEAQPRSDWDLETYACNAFDDDDDFAPSGPASYLYPATMTYQGYLFWAWMLERLDAQQQSALTRNATQIAQDTEALRFLGELPLPATLCIGL